MPPPAGTKKKKGRAPKHQNTFAFKHNLKSKKTDKILASPNVGMCRRCHDKIEWRKKYRKYKPRTQPGKCNACGKKNVMAAYHTICDSCTSKEDEITAMLARMHGTLRTDEESQSQPTDSNPAESNNCELSAAIKPKLNKNIRVCAMCTNCPAMSKYSSASPEDMEIVQQLQEMEDMVEDGVHSDGHRLTLREVKGLQRKIEKLQVELKERKKKRADKREEQGEEEEQSDQDSENEEEDSGNEQEDAFHKATGGNALVGEEYQKMLLAKSQQWNDSEYDGDTGGGNRSVKNPHRFKYYQQA